MSDVAHLNDDPDGAKTTDTDKPSDDKEKIEARAKRMGWRPKDEFHGNPDDFVEAEDYINRIEERLPALQERNRFLDEQLAAQKTEREKDREEIGELKTRLEEMTGVFSEFRDHSAKAQEVAYQRGKSDAQARMDAAAAEGDMDEYNRAKQDLEAVEATKPEPKKEDPQKPETKPEETPAKTGIDSNDPLSPVEQAWIDNNATIMKDATMNPFMVQLYSQNRAAGMSEQKALDTAEQEVRKRFPEKFENPRRDEPSDVSSPSGGKPPKKKGRTYEDLPEEAKAACDRFVRDIPDYTREDYLKEYDWDAS